MKAAAIANSIPSNTHIDLEMHGQAAVSSLLYVTSSDEACPTRPQGKAWE